MDKRRYHKLRYKWQFQQVYNTGQKVSGKYLVLFYLYKNDRLRLTRLGITVTKKIGDAVVRNKFKRRVREIFFNNMPSIKPGYDLVVIAKRTSINATYQDLSDEAAKIFQQAGVFYKPNTA
ncbi:ribonuclease P protein component [bacterium]|nr:ribonuclease P protein component [bacterium]